MATNPTWRMAGALAYLDVQHGKVLPMFTRLKTRHQSPQAAREAAVSLMRSEEFETEFELLEPLPVGGSRTIYRLHSAVRPHA